MRRVTRLACLATLLSGTALTSTAVQAEETTPIQTLDGVTVYATKNAQSTFTVPGMVNVVDTDKPGTVLANDTSDLFEFTPGIEVEGSARRNGQVLNIRGFDNDAIITLMDGRRQNFEGAHDGNLFLDPALLKRAEVVKGASSAIYGGGAIGGVVAFETVNASDLLAPGVNFGGRTTIGGRTANGELTASQSVYGRTEQFDWLASLSYLDDGDIRLGNGTELEAHNQIFSGLLKGSVSIGDWSSVEMSLHALRNDGDEPSNPQAATGTVVDKKVEDFQGGIRYRYENPDETWLRPELHFFVNDTELETEDDTGSNAGRVQTRKITTVGFSANNRQPAFAVGDSEHALTWGVEIYTDKQVGTNSAAADGKRDAAPDADALSWGVFVQDDIQLETALGAVQLIPAVRFDSYQSEDDAGRSQNEGAVSPKISASLQPANGVLLFGSLAQAFRAPNMTEIYVDGVHFVAGPVTNNFVPNPDLKPETVTTAELGAGYQFNNLTTEGDAGHIKGAVFYSYGEDFISQFTDDLVFGIPSTTKTENVPEAVLKGVELEASYNLGNLRTSAGFHVVYAKNNKTGASLDGNTVAPTLTTDIGWVQPGIDTIFGVRSRYVSEYESGSTVRDGYGVQDLYMRWAPTGNQVLAGVKVDVGIDNLFDKAYQRRNPSFEEGRSTNVKVSWAW